jgi:hypothetical protein
MITILMCLTENKHIYYCFSNSIKQRDVLYQNSQHFNLCTNRTSHMPAFSYVKELLLTVGDKEFSSATSL